MSSDRKEARKAVSFADPEPKATDDESGSGENEPRTGTPSRLEGEEPLRSEPEDSQTKADTKTIPPHNPSLPNDIPLANHTGTPLTQSPFKMHHDLVYSPTTRLATPGTPLHVPKPILKAENANNIKPQTIFCEKCKESIPAEDWPNHRDRLRTVKTVSEVHRFHNYLKSLFMDFLMWLLVNVYFREVAVVGLENVPRNGAVVFYGNHQNQFIDALMIRSNCGRSVRYIIAEKSMHRPVIGEFARAMNAVPVVRPQDVTAHQGVGKLISVVGKVTRGEGTRFTKDINVGDVLTWMVPKFKDLCTGQVAEIVSDMEVLLTLPVPTEHEVTQPTSYKFSERIDHSLMYANVYDTLERGDCIGIFPEGGSHDRTSLLPLKAGVALFSLGAAERGIPVTIVPCGLTYFYGHKFRSRAHIEFGEPIAPSKELVELFKTDKRKATGLLLSDLDVALRSITINVPDWESLKFLHTFRHLYQPQRCVLSARNYLSLSRRMSLIMDAQKGNPEFIDFRNKVQNYTDFCSALLVRDSQAATLENLDDSEKSLVKLLARRSLMILVMGVILIPFYILAIPVGLIAHITTENHTRTALSTSKVKVVGVDVKASFKLIFGFLAFPLIVFVFGSITWWFFGFRIALTVVASLPMAMYVSLLIQQELVLEIRAALPLFMSLISKHKQFKKLYERRQALVELTQQLVKKWEPELEMEMSEIIKNSKIHSTREPSLFSLKQSTRRKNNDKKRQ